MFDDHGSALEGAARFIYSNSSEWLAAVLHVADCINWLQLT
jgi:hypothetical protein